MDELVPIETTDPELRQLLGLFDAPAFARRGQDLEYALDRLHAKLRRERESMLEMVRLRLRQWGSSAAHADAWKPVFAEPIDALWPLSGADRSARGPRPPAPRRLRAVARELVASVERFNRRWMRFVETLNLEPVNRSIEDYNRYYTLEKECSLGSARLAARHFVPKTSLVPSALLAQYPLLPVPSLLP
jgi:hypothetical protein